MEGVANMFSNEGGSGEGMPFAEAVEVGQEVRTSYGTAFARPDSRLLPFDRTEAIRQNARKHVAFGASSNRKLGAGEAKLMLIDLMKRIGINTKVENVQLAFLNAILLAHAKNSGSVLTPERAVFYVGAEGDPDRLAMNYFTNVVAVLDKDTRRFFRSYADYTREILTDLMSQRASSDPCVLEDIADIDDIAHRRGLSRYPELSFDSADACRVLPPNVRDILAMSKAQVLEKSVNAVDGVKVIRPAAAAAPSVYSTADSHLSSTGSSGGLDY